MPNGYRLATHAKELCDEYGFEILSPVLGDGNNEDFSSLTKERTAKKIFENNIGFIDKCDILVANINNFRGWEPDSGTCFEIGYAYSKGKKLYCFIDDMRPCYEKYIGSIHKDEGFWRDDNGAFFRIQLCEPYDKRPGQNCPRGFGTGFANDKKRFGTGRIKDVYR